MPKTGAGTEIKQRGSRGELRNTFKDACPKQATGHRGLHTTSGAACACPKQAPEQAPYPKPAPKQHDFHNAFEALKAFKRAGQGPFL